MPIPRAGRRTNPQKKLQILLVVGNTLTAIVLLYPLTDPENRGTTELLVRCAGGLLTLIIAATSLAGLRKAR